MSEIGPINILLVEDDEVDAMAIKRAFKKSNLIHTITEAKDGKAAFKLLKNGRVASPVIILLDLNLPKMPGIEFLDELRNDPQLRNHIVFVLTTSKAQEDKLAAYSFNIAGYLYKETVGKNFQNLTKMLELYWEMVEMPLC